jgi:C1A family cysteine protease
MQGCDGGDFTAADYFIHPKGAPAYGSDGDYDAYQSTCKPQPAVASAVAYHMLGDAKTGPSFKDIAYVLGVLHRPVSVDLAVDDNWQNYSWGTYNNCSDNNPSDINHMVVIEGYDCEKSVDSKGNCVFDQNGNLPANTGSWVIRNSWGTSWGDSGYIKMKATSSDGKRCDAVATDALYFDIN